MAQEITFFNTMFALNHAQSLGKMTEEAVDRALRMIHSNRILAAHLKPIVEDCCPPEHRDTVWAMILKAEQDGDLSSFHPTN